VEQVILLKLILIKEILEEQHPQQEVVLVPLEVVEQLQRD
jgi:hypothetical protein